MTKRWIPVSFALVSSVDAAACDRPPSVELREWTPADHDGEQKSAAGTNGTAPRQGAKGDAGGTPTLVAVTWQNQCATCHGAQGRGDGPQGPMFKPTDLTQAAWQDRTTDEAIASAIQNGKGRMPRFDLPDDVVRGLVGRVRAFRAP